ncbi:uncharacterized protein LODBEIA_P04940 [Lodderomyces beijingensis]|uniref:Uncharacterized protein n=1 Tax=Lodderomyces beijingensis TaxID=1775926 RepID=A0ABP0ZIV9_9ASCO
MTELYFLRHAERIDHALKKSPSAKPITEEYKPFDPSLSESGVEQLKTTVEDICHTTSAFTDKESSLRKNVYIHFSPYLRCCQTADVLITELKAKFAESFPNYKVRFQLLGDFALSEWVHETMENKPPYVDSNDAYNMYTPNLKRLKNKNACSNFRPTITLGHYNGPGLSFDEYEQRCKEYFQKLLATYDKPSYIKNQDIIVVVSHGYLINNLMSYFVSHPIFQEIPEAAINFARREKKQEFENSQDDDFDPGHYVWRMEKDALDLCENEEEDTVLNLESNIIYYKTNFIKKEDMASKPSKVQQMKDEYKPRASFKIESTSASQSGDGKQPHIQNYLCPAAKDWIPDAKHFQIRENFKEKLINDESFKRGFSITHPPSRKLSPDVSPNSAPGRTNSVIDLSKILSNESIQPLKLKYSNTSDIPIHKLNSKVNSQVNLQSLAQGSSTEDSHTDLPKYVSHLQNRHRSSSNPNSSVFVVPQSKDSYFPQVINRVRSNESDMSLDSVGEQSFDELDIIDEKSEPLFTSAGSAAANANAVRASPIDTLNRARSLNKKRTNNPLLLSYERRSQQNVSTTFGKMTTASPAIGDTEERGGTDAQAERGRPKSSNDATNDSDGENDRDRGSDNDGNSDSDSDSGSDAASFHSSNSEEKNFLLKFTKKPCGGGSTHDFTPRSQIDTSSCKPGNNSINFYSNATNTTTTRNTNANTNATTSNNNNAPLANVTKKSRPVFYNFDPSDDSDPEITDMRSAQNFNRDLNQSPSRNEDRYLWFGQKRS